MSNKNHGEPLSPKSTRPLKRSASFRLSAWNNREDGSLAWQFHRPEQGGRRGAGILPDHRPAPPAGADAAPARVFLEG